MPYPFVVPAGMIAVRIAGRWVLRKISEHLKQRRKEVEQRKGASVVKKKKTAKPESSMKTKKKATRTEKQMERLDTKLKQNRRKLLVSRSANRVGGSTSPDGRRRAMIESKGGLLDDIDEFRDKLARQDQSTNQIVQAYKRLRLHKTTIDKPLPRVKLNKFGRQSPTSYRRRQLRQEDKELSKKDSKKEAKYIERKFYPKDLRSRDLDAPIIKKLIRDGKRSVKEAYKKEVKKNRLTRKHQDSKEKANKRKRK